MVRIVREKIMLKSLVIYSQNGIDRQPNDQNVDSEGKRRIQ